MTLLKEHASPDELDLSDFGFGQLLAHGDLQYRNVIVFKPDKRWPSWSRGAVGFNVRGIRRLTGRVGGSRPASLANTCFVRVATAGMLYAIVLSHRERRVAILRESADAIACWLQEKSGVANVEWDAIFDRDVALFRLYRDEPPSPELEVTAEALEDHPSETILADLDDQQVVQRLVADPTMRLRYYTRREVPPREEMWVRCDGRRYRVLRDSGHNVRIFDNAGRLLDNIPDTLLVMPSSVFRKSNQKWCREIREWRGATQ